MQLIPEQTNRAYKHASATDGHWPLSRRYGLTTTCPSCLHPTAHSLDHTPFHNLAVLATATTPARRCHDSTITPCIGPGFHGALGGTTSRFYSATVTVLGVTPHTSGRRSTTTTRCRRGSPRATWKTPTASNTTITDVSHTGAPDSVHPSYLSRTLSPRPCQEPPSTCLGVILEPYNSL